MAVKDLENETLVRVASKDEEVRIMFGELVAWVGLSPLKAIELADNIRDAAEKILRSDA